MAIAIVVVDATCPFPGVADIGVYSMSSHQLPPVALVE